MTQNRAEIVEALAERLKREAVQQAQEARTLLSGGAGVSELHEKIAESHPSLRRGQVWCRTCGREKRIDSALAIRFGWPKCCGYTMTIDHPDTWKDASHD